MYLFVWATAEVRQFKDNLTVYDITAAKTGVLNIYKFDQAKGFLRLVFDLEKVVWVPVKEGRVLQTQEFRIHST